MAYRNYPRHPNPASGNYIKLRAELPIIQVDIYAISGEHCYSGESDGSNLQFIDISNLNPGAYIVQIQTEEKTYRQKMIKQ